MSSDPCNHMDSGDDDH